MNIFQAILASVVLSTPIPECGCSPPVLESPSQAREVVASYDLIFVGVVSARKPKVIDPEYFGQNVRKMLVTFAVGKWVKGADLERVEALASISAACERFHVSTEYLVFAKLVNGTYRIEYCAGAKRTGPGTEKEVELLLGTATTNKALHGASWLSVTFLAFARKPPDTGRKLA